MSKYEVKWMSPTAIPEVKIGESRAFWIATEVKTGRRVEVVVEAAHYVNCPIEFDEHGEPKELNYYLYSVDGDVFDALGWFNLVDSCDYDQLFTRINFSNDRKLLGWAEWAEYAAPEFTATFEKNQ